MPVVRPAVGGVTLLSLGAKGGGGDLNNPGTKLVRITRAGADGVGLRKSAKQPQTTTLRGVAPAADVTAAALLEATTLPAVQGAVVTIVIAGATHPNFAVERAQVMGRRPCTKATGFTPAPTFLVDCEFDVVYAGT